MHHHPVSSSATPASRPWAAELEGRGGAGLKGSQLTRAAGVVDRRLGLIRDEQHGPSSSPRQPDGVVSGSCESQPVSAEHAGLNLQRFPSRRLIQPEQSLSKKLKPEAKPMQPQRSTRLCHMRFVHTRVQQVCFCVRGVCGVQVQSSTLFLAPPVRAEGTISSVCLWMWLKPGKIASR